LLLAFFLAGWLPYVLADAIKRPVFMFYATPLVPFIVLSVVHVWRRALTWLPDIRLAPILYLVLVAGVFAYFYPVLAGLPISPSGFFGWGGHMWLQADCTMDNKVKIACWI
jgi:dolichyl-phosphate-mannose-protein mannosyltransferase